MSILNWQVKPSSNFVSLLILMAHNSPVSFKVIHFLFWIKGHKVQIFRLSNACSRKNLPNSSCYFWKHKSVFRQIFASIFSAIKINSSVLSLAQTLCTLVKSSPLKCNFLSFSSAQVKICQIPHVNFELTSQVLFKFCIILHCHDT